MSALPCPALHSALEAVCVSQYAADTDPSTVYPASKIHKGSPGWASRLPWGVMHMSPRVFHCERGTLPASRLPDPWIPCHLKLHGAPLTPQVHPLHLVC